MRFALAAVTPGRERVNFAASEQQPLLESVRREVGVTGVRVSVFVSCGAVGRESGTSAPAKRLLVGSGDGSSLV